ncbi:hypothetical protein XHV734_2572 [Xanthomonas hortorum pv. vitians]|nr:hypothetical protein XHV734_2572 [Xanthomonas hortorum pv. vitians]
MWPLYGSSLRALDDLRRGPHNLSPIPWLALDDRFRDRAATGTVVRLHYATIRAAAWYA